MKKYYVISVMWGDYGDSYEFDNLSEARAFFDKKAKGLRYEMIKENDSSVIKFKKGDSWGYELREGDETIDSASYTWED